MKWLIIISLSLGLSMGLAGQEGPGAREARVYVGTYTFRGGEGIYVYRMDLSTGALQSLSTAPPPARS